MRSRTIITLLVMILLFSNAAATANNAPVIAEIPDMSFIEDSGFNDNVVDLWDYTTDETPDPDLTYTITSQTYKSRVECEIDANHYVDCTTKANESGSSDVTVKAQDPEGGYGTNKFKITVQPVNDPPTISNIPDRTVTECANFSTFDLDGYVADVDNTDAQITWAVAGNTSLNVAISTGHVVTITYMCGWLGSETLTFTATDPYGLASSDTATFRVTASPVVSPMPDITLDEDTYAVLNLNDYVEDANTPDPDITWTYAGNSVNVNITIDGDNIATIIPKKDWYGNDTGIKFTASDGEYEGYDTITVNVNSINDPPIVSDIPDKTVTECANFPTFDLDGYVTDVDNTDAQITWAVTGNTSLGVNISSGHVVTISYVCGWLGSETLTFTATDSYGLASSDTAAFKVISPPVVSTIPDITLDEDTYAVLNLNDYVTDADTSDLGITWTYTGNSKVSISIDENNIATITPESNWYGSDTGIKFTASDGDNEDYDTITVAVNSINDPPIVLGIHGQAVTGCNSFTTFDLDDNVTDVDNSDSQIGWTVTGNTNLSVKINSYHVATITYVCGWTGSETLTFTATDPGGLASSGTAVFKVSSSPSINDIPEQVLDEELGLNEKITDLWNYASDVEDLDSELTFSITEQTNEGLVHCSISDNRYIDCEVKEVSIGSSGVTVKVEDPEGLSDTAVFTVNIQQINDPPEISDIPDMVLDEDNNATINLDDFIQDVDTDDKDIEWSFEGNENITISIGENHVATLTPSENWNGQETITFTASDGEYEVSDELTVTVNPVNDAPKTSDIGEITFEEDTSKTIDLNDYVNDVDNSDSDITWDFEGNENIKVSINKNNIATLTPASNWYGSETITFTASDGGEETAESIATITITNVNDAPVMGPVENITVTEGDLVKIEPTATDADGDMITFNFTKPLDENGQWQTASSDAGTYTITVTADDSNGGTATQDVVITVDKDSDGDKAPDDISDNLLYNPSKVDTNIESLSIIVGGSENTSQTFTGTQTIEMKEDEQPLVSFDHNFDVGALDLLQLAVTKQEKNATQGSILIKGITLTNTTKTGYFDRLSGRDYVCIKDEELTSVAELPSVACSGAGEIPVPCSVSGSSASGYNCTIVGNRFKVDGLSHSGIVESTYAPAPDIKGLDHSKQKKWQSSEEIIQKKEEVQKTEAEETPKEEKKEQTVGPEKFTPEAEKTASNTASIFNRAVKGFKEIAGSVIGTVGENAGFSSLTAVILLGIILVLFTKVYSGRRMH